MPEHPRSALGAGGLRRIDWERRPAAEIAGKFDRRGRELEARSRPRLVLSCASHPSGTNEETTKKRFGASAPGAHPQKTGARSSARNQRAADIALNGQRVGELQESFWTGPRRPIAALESGLRFGPSGLDADPLD